MALSWNEIKSRALEFSKEWEGESREHAEAKSFWDGFFHVFGISRRRVATFEEPVKKLNEHYGFIDLFWKGRLLIEHKSQGKDLDKAYTQALDYFAGLKEHELPRYVLVSDFDRFRLYDMEEGEEHDFRLRDLHKNARLFGFIAGYQKKTYKEEDPVNIKAAYLMGTLHDQLKDIGYDGHSLEVYLVRLLFCLFADDTGIFEKDSFLEYIENRTNEDGSDLAMHFAKIFEVLNKPKDKRLKNLDEDLMALPYVNGKLFEEQLPLAAFNSKMRQTLIDCCYLDWGKTSPAIFGAMFQSIMDKVERRELGAHYTSEKNILKLIKPLFLDGLWAEFKKAKGNKRQLHEFHKKLSTLRFLDPACGCGNFLIITYRELRLLELEILQELNKTGTGFLDVSDIIWVDVDQFYGIEIDEWPARIAEVAMWLMDHQMNMRISEEFGQYFVRLPLKKSATIVQGNALRIDWEEIVGKGELSYILGNPPFCGYSLQSREQKEDIMLVFDGVNGAGVLDYVTGWYIKAAQYIYDSNIKVGFVSTNSIVQGEQVGILWNELFRKYDINIHFAHRTFRWNNKAKGNAAVHVVIIGFAVIDCKSKVIYDYEDINGEAHEIKAQNINQYLVDSPNVIIMPRRKPICQVLPMVYGNKPADGGNLILTDEEKKELIKFEPKSKKYIKPFLSAKEFLHNKKRWCLWLVNSTPSELRALPLVLKRVEAVRRFREESTKAATRELAATPSLFAEIRQAKGEYVLVPRHSSERRSYIPYGFFDKNKIVADSCFCIPDCDMYSWAVIQSAMHMAWVKYTCGRIKSDYRYSAKIVYNNYPWPKEPSAKNKKKVEDCAQKVLNARAEFPDSSLADLYDPLTMPPKLVKAHQALDKAVDLCYRPQAFANEMVRIEFLFGLYKEYTELLLVEGK